MAIGIIRGPAGGGKSQVIAARLRPGEVVIDFTRLYVALAGVERGPDGRYPVRHDGDPRLALAEYVRMVAVRQASDRELSGYATTSDSRPEAVERLRDAGATGPVETVDPGREVVRARLADAGDGRLVATVRASHRQVVPMTEIRCAVELRADDERRGPGRLTGTLLTYGEPRGDGRERFAPGALRWPADGVVLRRQHSPFEPITRVVPEVRGDRVVVDSPLPDTKAGRDAATEVRSGLFKGLSVEFRSVAERYVAGVREIRRALLVGAGLVDDPAYKLSRVEVRARGRRLWL